MHHSVNDDGRRPRQIVLYVLEGSSGVSRNAYDTINRGQVTKKTRLEREVKDDVQKEKRLAKQTGLRMYRKIG